MKLIDIKNYFEQCSEPAFFLTDVFSWRGYYNEVAFVPSRKGTREESLELINRALTETFEGYKGGEYTFDNYTTVHFEPYQSSCTDIALFNLLINKLTNINNNKQ